MNRIIGVDPGSERHSMVVLSDMGIEGVYNDLLAEQFYDKITKYVTCGGSTVVIEDLAAYSLRLTPQVISTAKFIGEAAYRLKSSVCCDLVFTPRSAIKKWCFDEFELAKQLCRYKIEKAVQKGKYEHRQASFVYVDDKIVTECMKQYWGIKKPAAGRGYDFGLKDHSWQALAVATHKKAHPKNRAGVSH
jgi:hypothetical protein